MGMDIGASFSIAASTTGQQSVDKLLSSISKIGPAGQVSAAQTAQAFRMLPAQFTDIATQLAGGQSPFLILLQQGGQIKDQFGGIIPTFKALAGALTPFRIAIGGVAAVAGTLATAFYRGQQEVGDFNKAIAETGNYAGRSYTQMLQFSRQLASVSGLSVGDTKDLMSGAISSGAFSSQSIDQVVQAMARVKYITGQTADSVVKDFSSMATGVAAWAAEHNRRYNYLTVDQYKYIRQLEIQGEYEKAAAVNATLLTDELSKRKPELGYLEQAWRSMGNAASRAWDSMLNIGRPNTLDDQIDKAKTKINELQNAIEARKAGRGALFGKAGLDGMRAELQLAEQNLANLQQNQRETQKLMGMDAQLSAQRKKEVEEEARGITKQKSDNAIEVSNTRLKSAADAEIQLLQRRQVALDELRGKALVGEEDYINRSTALKKQEIDEQVKLIEAEVANEKKRSVNSLGDQLAQAARVAQMTAQIKALRDQQETLQAKGGSDAGLAEFRQAKAMREYAEDLAFANEMLRLQGDAAKYSTVEYQMLVDQKQREHDIAVKTRGMTEEDAAAYRKSAEEAGKLTTSLRAQNYEKERSVALREYSEGLRFNNEMLMLQGKAVEYSSVEYQILVAQKQREYDITVATRRMTTDAAAAYRDAAEGAGKLTDEITRQNAARARTVSGGVSEFLKTYVEDITNAGKQIQSFMQNTMQVIEDTMVTGFTTGKWAFKDMANSIITDLIRIELRKNVMGPISGAIGDVLKGGTGSIFGGISKMFSFDGGGYTGSGSRSGGMDGKGGFFAMVHPNETVVDHTKGQTTGGSNISISVAVDASGQTSNSGTGQGAQLGNMIAASIRSVIIQEQRPGGLLAA